MKWESVNAFFAMGGRGLYVWSSFGMCVLVVVLELWLLRRFRRKLYQTLKTEENDLEKHSMESR